MSTPILKRLHADPSTSIDLNQYKPELSAEAQETWDYYLDNTPFWWSVHDLPTFERYCQLIGLTKQLNQDIEKARANDKPKAVFDLWSVVKSASLEVQKLEYALGLTPQSRAALKLELPADQTGREEPSGGDDPLDPAEL